MKGSEQSLALKTIRMVWLIAKMGVQTVVVVEEMGALGTRRHEGRSQGTSWRLQRFLGAISIYRQLAESSPLLESQIEWDRRSSAIRYAHSTI